MQVRKKKAPALGVLLNSCLLLAFAYSAINSAISAEDIRIKNYNGTMKMANPKGGYIVDHISGDAFLKATGSIRIGSISGNLEAMTPVGDIDIGEANGNVKAISHSGNVNIQRAHKHASVEAGLGEVVIQSAKTVDVENNFGGDVKLLDVLEYSKVVASFEIEKIFKTSEVMPTTVETYLDSAACGIPIEVGSKYVFITDINGSVNYCTSRLIPKYSYDPEIESYLKDLEANK